MHFKMVPQAFVPSYLSLTASTYWVLSGQHISCALNHLRIKALEEGLEPNLYYRQVDAEVLHYSTPREQRELYAGEHQLLQQSVAKTQWSQLAALALPGPDRPDDPAARLLQAVAKSGPPSDEQGMCCCTLPPAAL